ncbi:MAG: hypothetical protein WD830_12275 [Chloroflexota bacterium]
MKISDLLAAESSTARPSAAAPVIPGTTAYWLEDDRGQRISKMFADSEQPLKLAGRVLENVGSLRGWAIVRRDLAGARHVVAADDALESMAASFMPGRTPAEAEALARLNGARRALGFRRANVVRDERVY